MAAGQIERWRLVNTANTRFVRLSSHVLEHHAMGMMASFEVIR